MSNHTPGPWRWWKNQRGYIEGKFLLEDGSYLRAKQHRHIMEESLGRPLKEDEDVHHLNGIKDDNRIENLEVINHGEHTKQHNKKRQYKKGYKMNLTDEQRIETRLTQLQAENKRLNSALFSYEKLVADSQHLSNFDELTTENAALKEDHHRCELAIKESMEFHEENLKLATALAHFNLEQNRRHQHQQPRIC